MAGGRGAQERAYFSDERDKSTFTCQVLLKVSGTGERLCIQEEDSSPSGAGENGRIRVRSEELCAP